MLNSKHRSFLRSMAHDIPDIIHVGKEGITPNLIVQTKDALKSREIVKGKVQQNSIEDVQSVAESLAISTSSEIICVIGNKFVLYKYNHTNPVIEFPKVKRKGRQGE
ncbi:RNA-binding protein [Alkalibaculum sp. M08DMB]|uniref:RNA-binding protein n=1 Tax=Alkalibaculum sporogenes TaxID=2655001 RepID=A0A6A7K8T8_9FIRM|nr:YhbY family RNA-binding protein [Alkalibaculum sporogenes]MPW25919.1 RNA-binding protein [Alkalibaculum sporogenes]